MNEGSRTSLRSRISLFDQPRSSRKFSRSFDRNHKNHFVHSSASLKPYASTSRLLDLESQEEKQNHYLKLGIHASILWKHRKVTDVNVKLGNHHYPAHKPVLSCYSTCFKTLISDEPEADIINIDHYDVTNEAFEIILYFMYTGKLKITCQNIGSVYTAARKLGVETALNECIKIFKGKKNPITQPMYIYATAKKLGELDAAARALRVMAKHFEQVVGTKEFLHLDHEEVCELLSYDELAVRSEVVVYLAALKWLSVKFLERERYIKPIISCVRFPLMTLNEILACHSPPLLPGVTQVPAVHLMLLKATCYVAARTVNEEKLFQEYACEPRTYLIKRNPLILWDPHIYDPERYDQYKKEMAATTIQANFRGYKTRKSLAHILHLNRQQSEPNSDASFGGNTSPSSRSGVGEQNEEVESSNLSNAWNTRPKVPSNNPTSQDSNPPDQSSSDKKPKNRKSSGFAARLSFVAAETVQDMVRRIKNPNQQKKNGNPSSGKNVTSKDDYPTASDQEELDTDNLFKLNPNEANNPHDKRLRQKLDSSMIVVLGGMDPKFDEQEEYQIQLGKSMLAFIPGANEWSEFDEMPFPRHHMCAVYLDGSIYCIGGCDPIMSRLSKSVPETSCRRYDIKSKEWYPIASMTYARMNHGAGVIKGKIYVAGGKDDENMMLDSLEYYAPDENVWQLLRVRLSAPKMGSGVCVHRDQLWIVGGTVLDEEGKQCFVREVEYYDPLDDKLWRDIPKIPLPLCFPSLVECQGRVYLIGGSTYLDEDDTEENKVCSVSHVCVYDSKAKLWLPRTPLPTARHLISTVALGGNIYAIDGLATPSTPVSEVHVYDTARDLWSTCKSLPTVRRGISAVSIPKMA